MNDEARATELKLLEADVKKLILDLRYYEGALGNACRAMLMSSGRVMVSVDNDYAPELTTSIQKRLTDQGYVISLDGVKEPWRQMWVTRA